jgi:hypothetical protein
MKPVNSSSRSAHHSRTSGRVTLSKIHIQQGRDRSHTEHQRSNLMSSELLDSAGFRRPARYGTGSMRFALLALTVFGCAALLSTANVTGSSAGGRQAYIPPVRSLTTSSSFTRLDVQTRANFVLPSQFYDVQVEAESPVYDLGPLAPGALSNVQDNQIGVSRSVTDDVDSESAIIRNPDGTRLRLFSIRSEDAQAIRLHFTGLDLPDGDQLFVYGQRSDSHVAGPYTGKGPFGTGDFWADVVEGDTAIVEHLVASKKAKSKVVVSEVSHIFVGLDSSSFVPQILSCEVDASCGVFAEKDAVARILFQDGGSFVCTGTLVNDRAQDQTPYFMTAAHCVSNETVAQTVQAFWFYQTTSCNASTLRTSPMTSGMTLLATSSAADSTLLKMLTAPPNGVVFVGWDPNQRPEATEVFGLHHPGGGIPSSTSSFLRSASGAITGLANCPASGLINGYIVTWATGDTEPGSSGSALFANDGLGLIGVLSCGPSPASCSTPLSLYSRFSDFYPLAQPFLEGTGTTTCITGLSPQSKDFSSLSGSGSFTVNAPGTCNWTAVVNDSWITIISGGSGTGGGTVNYVIAANQSAAARTGTITVQGHLYTIHQEGTVCTFPLDPTSKTFVAAGGNGSVNVTTGNSCAWTASPTAAWITITSGGVGVGNGTVQYSVAPNPGTDQRIGQIMVQDQIHTVTQNGINCSFTLSPLGATLNSNAANGSITVSAGTGCAWTATSNAGFLTITGGASGLGNGTVNYSITANPGTNSRNAQISIADKTFSVTQARAPVIQDAVKDQKNIILTGLNFADGADVLMNGVPQPKIKNDSSNPTTRLICKKMIKRISRGQSVTLQVQNPDGSRSNSVVYMRPALVGAGSVDGIRQLPRVQAPFSRAQRRTVRAHRK